MEAHLAPLSPFLGICLYPLKREANMCAFSSLCASSYLRCFKEELTVVHRNREVSAEHFDKPPPRQLIQLTMN